MCTTAAEVYALEHVKRCYRACTSKCALRNMTLAGLEPEYQSDGLNRCREVSTTPLCVGVLILFGDCRLRKSRRALCRRIIDSKRSGESVLLCKTPLNR